LTYDRFVSVADGAGGDPRLRTSTAKGATLPYPPGTSRRSIVGFLQEKQQ
jgi:hypothetical protein